MHSVDIWRYGFALMAAVSSKAPQAFRRQARAYVSAGTAAQLWRRPKKIANSPNCHNSTSAPNPSLKRSANGRPPAPGRRYAVHFRRPGAGVLPSFPA